MLRWQMIWKYTVLLFLAGVIGLGIFYRTPVLNEGKRLVAGRLMTKKYASTQSPVETHWDGNLTEHVLCRLVTQKAVENKKRLGEVVRLCESEKSLEFKPPPEFMYGIPKLRMSITLTPKVGSTSWLALMEKLQARHCHAYRKSDTNYFGKLHDCVKAAIAKLDVNQPVKAVVVRDPWHRLTSFYENKILMDWYYAMSFCYKRWGVVRNTEANKGKVIDTPNLNFSQVITCILGTKNLMDMDVHYRPQFLVQGLCGTNYTHIGRLEDIENDLAFFFKSAQPSFSAQQIQELIDEYHGGPRRLSELVASEQKHQKYIKYYQSLSADQIHSLQELYKWDIQIHSYQRHPLDT